MTDIDLTTLEIEPATPPKAAIIWLHGLGADARDFEPIVPHLGVPDELGLRFVFPNAPERPVTINGGMRMRAWYDILSMDIPKREDDIGIRDSERLLQRLIRREHKRGIPVNKILLAGFSQGGAMTLHTGIRYAETLGGLLALSGYLPLGATVTDERHPANQDTPILLAHGRYDQVVPYAAGEKSAQRLQQLGYTVEWHPYPMQHEVSLEEIQDVGAWLRKVLSL